MVKKTRRVQETKESLRKKDSNRWRTQVSRLFLSVVIGFAMSGPLFFTRYLNPYLSHITKSATLSQGKSFQKSAKRDTNGNLWLWYNYSHTSGIRRPRKRLLIVQFTGFGSYERLLDHSWKISVLYAKAWGHDVVIMKGITKRLKTRKNQTLTEAHNSMYNKVDYLNMALAFENKDKYDNLLILDSDSMIVNFSKDLTDLMDDEDMLVAQKTHEEDRPSTHRINAGVLLWNLNHPLTKEVAMEWDEGCIEAIKKNYSLRGDQYYLVEALKKDNRTAAVRAVQKEFHYRSASVIKHFIREDSCSWDGSSLDAREEEMRNVSMEIADRFQLDLSTMTFHNRTALFYPPGISNESFHQSPTSGLEPQLSYPEPAFQDLEFKEDTLGCQKRQDPVWDLVEYDHNLNSGKGKKLLIAQYTGFGRDDRYLNMTVAVNKYYARKFGHDFVTLRGPAFKTPFDGSCELPPKRSIYNRVALVSRSSRNRDIYNQVLVMHDGALISDLDFDVQNLLDNNTILVATRASKCDAERTARLRLEITLWNLNHTKSEPFLQSWFRQVGSDLREAKERNITASGDETCLRRALQRNKLKKFVKSKVKEFNGQIIQVFARNYADMWSTGGLNTTGEKINRAIAELCTKFPNDCGNFTMSI